MSITVCPECGIETLDNPPFGDTTWLGVVYNAVTQLHATANPHSQYFHYKQDICNYIDDNWTKLCPDKKRTKTWNNTISAVITTHPMIFERHPVQGGHWTLKKITDISLMTQKAEAGKTEARRLKTEAASSGDLPTTPRRRKPQKRSYSDLIGASPSSLSKLPTPKKAKSSSALMDSFIESQEVGPIVPLSSRRRRKVPPFAYPLVGGVLRQVAWSFLRRPKPQPPAITLPPQPPPTAHAPIAAAAPPSSVPAPLPPQDPLTPSLHMNIDDGFQMDIFHQAVPEMPPTPFIDATPPVRIDPSDPEVFFEEDEFGVPLPPGWFERITRLYSKQSKAITAPAADHNEEIPLPTWREFDEESEMVEFKREVPPPPTADIGVTSEGDNSAVPDEDDEQPEEKYVELHNYYEALEKRIKKFN